ncbi:MAG: methionyl-tRNA formyltransferase [Clostridiales bacterium]|nr:methionyl-tRNA formyltransferase [Clostridiales bacterium]
MRIVFMGTPEYAVQSLQALVEAGYAVEAVFTQPDKPKGRGGKVQMPPAKMYALQQGIEVYQPLKIRRDSVKNLKDLVPDICVTAAFGQILSKELLDIPRLGTVNVHASLLPQYRGSSPVNWCLINGETKTGVSTMLTDEGIDTGDILLQKAIDILPGETAGELTQRLGALGAQLLIETLQGLSAGQIIPRPQDEEESSYYPMLKKEMGLIDWTENAASIVNLIRGLNPWPTAFTDTKYGRLKLLQAQAADSPEQPPGTVVEADPKKGLVIRAGAGAVRVHLLQGEGGKIMKSSDYLRGHPLQTGERL